ncbi:MAG TPA: class I SAM-dependent methyltransferase [Bryobacteraceae bacterium]|nr:class I SAM-dependent methyltransferase [Bryobacteraceae bacterium]
MAARKSTPDEIRRRFDADVDRFSVLETGQSSTIDAPLALELIARAAAGVRPQAAALLDIGCGAGNYSLKLLHYLPLRSITLVDLSRPMLDRAVARIHTAAPDATVNAIQADVRETAFSENTFDVAVAAATLHHLREDSEWRNVFAAVHRALVPGGSFWVSDLIRHQSAAVQEMMWQRYGEYLIALKGPDYRDHVFGYVEAEDTPRPLYWQLDLLARTGFREIDVLHKNSCFAVFGGLK